MRLLELADGLVFGLTNVQLALLGSLVALIFAVTRWRRNTVTRRSTETPAHESRTIAPSPLSLREVTSEIQALLAELEETSRRLTAQLDNRYTRLEQLVAEADERIRRLEGLADHPQEASTQWPSANGTPVVDVQRTLSRLRQERGAPPAAEDPAYQPVYALADGGKSAREIAQELGRQPGEIELILALRQRRA